jgi:hypothetical protein
MDLKHVRHEDFLLIYRNKIINDEFLSELYNKYLWNILKLLNL